jgi:hypothetical protein
LSVPIRVLSNGVNRSCKGGRDHKCRCQLIQFRARRNIPTPKAHNGKQQQFIQSPLPGEQSMTLRRTETSQSAQKARLIAPKNHSKSFGIKQILPKMRTHPPMRSPPIRPKCRVPILRQPHRVKVGTTNEDASSSNPRKREDPKRQRRAASRHRRNNNFLWIAQEAHYNN